MKPRSWEVPPAAASRAGSAAASGAWAAWAPARSAGPWAGRARSAPRTSAPPLRASASGPARRPAGSATPPAARRAARAAPLLGAFIGGAALFLFARRWRGEAAARCWEAGACVVHVHARGPDGLNSGD
ncbi:MAG: 3-keto-5-aminohexanoate cleavage protein, partial [Caulobacter sp.]|nr:3-keto-5-aminohexanoate cleavage protein [Caulobacter sp.]